MKVNINTMSLDDISLIEPNFSQTFDKFWTIDILKNDFLSQNSKYIVATVDNEIVGFAGIKFILTDAEIMNIAVKIDKRNLGIGSILLVNLIQLANTYDCTSIFLEVNELNTAAIHLYEKYGFIRIGLRKKYYNNVDNAVIMKKEI